MGGPRVEDADPVPPLRRHMQADPEVLAAFGGPEHISGVPEAPWPHLVVSTGQGGSMLGGRWVTRPEVLFEVYGDPYARTSTALLRRLTYLVARVAVAVPEHPTPPGDPVVSLVEPGTPTAADLTTGQARWRVPAQVTIRPPSSSARR